MEIESSEKNYFRANSNSEQFYNIVDKVYNILVIASTNYEAFKHQIKRTIRENHICLRKSRKTIKKERFDKIIRSNKHQLFKRQINESIEGNSPFNLKININCVTNSFPINSRHYTRISHNTYCSFSEKYNLLDLAAFKEMAIKIFDSDKDQIMREKSSDYRLIGIFFEHKLKYICWEIIEKLGDQYIFMSALAKIIQKDPCSLIKIWNLVNKSDQNPNKHQVLFPHQGSKKIQKIQPYRYVKLFCSICQLYICNAHYHETDDQDIGPEFEFSSYTTQFQSLKNKCEDEEETYQLNWTELYKCSKNTKTCGNHSYFIPDESEDNSYLFKKYEKEFIKGYCLKYNLKNPCLIKFMMDTDKTCAQICEYISNMPNHIFEVKGNSQKHKTRCRKTSIFNEEFRPCYHQDKLCDNTCPCVSDRGVCEKICGCNIGCKYRFQGCNCKPLSCKENSKCLCVINQRECDPDLCNSCCSDINLKLVVQQSLKIPQCPNTSLTYNYRPRLLLSKSTLCDGMGIFAGEEFDKGAFIGEYVGEMLSLFEVNKREAIYEAIDQSYIFELTKTEVM